MADSLDEKIEEKFGHKGPQQFVTNEKNNIKHIISVVSGKGGVGKSFVTTSIAVNLRKRGFKVGILDSDITGPSIPTSFGIKEGVNGTEELMFPPITESGIEIMSINLMLENPDQPVLWRGPVLGNVIKQFYCDTYWNDLDFLLIDMPPGTGDVALTVFQSIPVDGAVIVSTPQDLVKMIVGKAVNMCDMMNVPVLGIIENMSYLVCDCCGKEIYPFGKSMLEALADEYNICPLGKMPINQKNVKLIDEGKADKLDTSYVEDIVDHILDNLN